MTDPCPDPLSIDDLLHAISLATAIPSDGIICMTGDGAQLNDDLLSTLSSEDQGQATVSAAAEPVDGAFPMCLLSSPTSLWPARIGILCLQSRLSLYGRRCTVS